MITVLKSSVGLKTPLIAGGYHLLNPLSSVEYALASILVINPVFQVGTTYDTSSVGLVTQGANQSELVKLKAGLLAALHGSTTISTYLESFGAANNIASVASAFVNTRDLTTHILSQGGGGIGLQLKLALEEMSNGASFNKITLRSIFKKLRSAGHSTVIDPASMIRISRHAVGSSTTDEGDTHASFTFHTTADDISLANIGDVISYFLGQVVAPNNSSLFQLADTMRTLALVQDFENGAFVSAAKSLQATVPLPSLEALNNNNLVEFMQANVAYSGIVTSYSLDLPFALLREYVDMIINSPELNRYYLIEQTDLRVRLDSLHAYKVVMGWPVHKVLGGLGECSSISIDTPMYRAQSKGLYKDVYDVIKASYALFTTVRSEALDGGIDKKTIEAPSEGSTSEALKTPNRRLAAHGPAPTRTLIETLHNDLLAILYSIEPYCEGPIGLSNLMTHRSGITINKKNVNQKLIADTIDDVVIGSGSFFRHHSDNNPFSLMNKLALSSNLLLKTMRDPTIVGTGDNLSDIANQLYVNYDDTMSISETKILLPTTRGMDDSLMSAMATKLLRLKPITNLEMVDPHTQLIIIPDANGLAGILGISQERVLDIFNHPMSKRLFLKKPAQGENYDIRLLKAAAPMFAINDAYVEEAKGVSVPAPLLSGSVCDNFIFDSTSLMIIGNDQSLVNLKTKSAIVTSSPGFNTTFLSASDVYTIPWGAYFNDEYSANPSVLLSTTFFN